jgi:hypothetical protein
MMIQLQKELAVRVGAWAWDSGGRRRRRRRQGRGATKHGAHAPCGPVLPTPQHSRGCWSVLYSCCLLGATAAACGEGGAALASGPGASSATDVRRGRRLRCTVAARLPPQEERFEDAAQLQAHINHQMTNNRLLRLVVAMESALTGGSWRGRQRGAQAVCCGTSMHSPSSPSCLICGWKQGRPSCKEGRARKGCACLLVGTAARRCQLWAGLSIAAVRSLTVTAFCCAPHTCRWPLRRGCRPAGRVPHPAAGRRGRC